MRAAPFRAVRAAVLAVAACAAVVASTADRSLGKGDPRIVDSKKKAYGLSMKDWAVQWYQWAASIPTAVSPLADTTGAFVEVGQRGPVWFLCGPYTSTVIERTATIPTGKALFFPIINGGQDYTNYGHEVPLDQLRQDAVQNLDAMDLSKTSADLDAFPIEHLERGRALTDPYDFALPSNNYFEDAGVIAPRGVYRPAVGFGYWLMLKPLAAGKHELHFHTEQGNPTPFAFDVTYDLTVVDHDEP